MNINGASSNGSSTDYSRITGLATGMDTDGMVQKMLAGDKAKIDQANQKLQTLQWQQEAYVDVIKDVKDLYNTFFSIDPSSDTSLMMSKAYSPFTVESTSDEVTAIAYAGAIKGQYTVKVDQVATGAIAVSGKTGILESKDSSGNKVAVDLNSKLSSLNNSLDLATSIKDGDFKITVTDPKTSSNSYTFTINVDSSKTIGDFLSSMKSQKDASGKVVLGNIVDVNFSELTKKLTISTKATGALQTLTIANGSIESNFGGVFGIGAPTAGTNAKVQITPPGETIATTIEKESNEFTIDNIKFNISNAKAGDTVNLNVKSDASGMLEKFKKFKDKYNELIDKINTKITQKKNYTYKPLTDDQKKGMKDDEIKKWEDKAKEGIIKGDSTLSNMLFSMREALYSQVEDAGLNITDLGISTTSNWRDGGKLQIDEEKFKSAVENRGDQVQKLFTSTSSSDKSKQGVFQKIKSILDDAVGLNGTLVKKAGYENSMWAFNNDISKSINEKNQTIKDLEKKMLAKQERYYKMFAALEKNMNNLNSQSNWLASQLGAQ